MDYSINYLGTNAATITITIPHDHPAVASLRAVLPDGDRVCRSYGCYDGGDIGDWSLSYWYFSRDGALTFDFSKPRARKAPPLADFEPVILAAIPTIEAEMKRRKVEAAAFEKTQRQGVIDNIVQALTSGVVDHIHREVRRVTFEHPDVKAAVALAQEEALKVATRERASINPDDIAPTLAAHQLSTCKSFGIGAEEQAAMVEQAKERIKAALAGEIPEKVYKVGGASIYF